MFLTLATGQAYDSHCNLVLGDVEETIYIVDDEDEDDEIKVRDRVASTTHITRNSLTPCQTVSKKSEMLFVRGKQLTTHHEWHLSCQN